MPAAEQKAEASVGVAAANNVLNTGILLAPKMGTRYMAGSSIREARCYDGKRQALAHAFGLRVGAQGD
jgi:hypothetical protein